MLEGAKEFLRERVAGSDFIRERDGEYLQGLRANGHLLVGCQRQGGEAPFPGQALGAGFAAGGCQLMKFTRVVDIERNAGERENDTRLLRCVRGGEVGLEAVI